MGKDEIVKHIVDECGTDRAITKDVVEAMINLLRQGISSREEFKVHGIGRFMKVRWAPRKGRHATTGEMIDIPARTVVKYVPEIGIKEKVNKYTL